MIVNFERDGKQYKEVELPTVSRIAKIGSDPTALIRWAGGAAADAFRDLLVKGISADGRIINYHSHIGDEWRDIALRAPDEIKRKSAGEGQAIHQDIARAIANLGDPDWAPEHEVTNSFLTWAKGERAVFRKSEGKVTNLQAGYGGTYDLIMERDGREWLVDIKTSPGLYDERLLQLAGYRICLGRPEMMSGLLIVDRKERTTTFIDVSQKVEAKERAFLDLVRAFYSLKKRRLKNNPWVSGELEVS